MQFLKLLNQVVNFQCMTKISVPDGLGVRIPDSHSGGPGSIPGQGEFFRLDCTVFHFT